MSQTTHQPITTPAAPPPQVAGHVARFQAFHGAVCQSALSLKLAKYFAGLEVNALYDLHHELYGELRGRPATSEIPEHPSGISETVEDFLETHLGVTSRTARKYRNFFLAINQANPEIAARLTGAWKTLALPAEAEAGAESAQPSEQLLAAATPQGCTLDADALQAICAHADEWGLHELFERPSKDVTPQAPDAPEKQAEKAALLKFWTESIIRRLDNQEYLRLPPSALEAVATKMEEHLKRAKEVLEQKKTKKAGKGRK